MYMYNDQGVFPQKLLNVERKVEWCCTKITDTVYEKGQETNECHGNMVEISTALPHEMLQLNT